MHVYHLSGAGQKPLQQSAPTNIAGRRSLHLEGVVEERPGDQSAWPDQAAVVASKELFRLAEDDCGGSIHSPVLLITAAFHVPASHLSRYKGLCDVGPVRHYSILVVRTTHRHMEHPSDRGWK